jgi:hypothetical protein
MKARRRSSIPPRGSIPTRTTMRDVLAKRVAGPAQREGDRIPTCEVTRNERGGRIVNAANMYTPHEEGRGGSPASAGFGSVR